MPHTNGNEYWDAVYASTGPRAAPPDHPIRRWIERHIPPTDTGSCLEIGCYPGRYLAVFGELGYELSGVDITRRLGELPAWLEDRGYRIGSFRREDFLGFAPGRLFDVVASFGFIEHFADWADVLERHAALVGAGGYLVVEAPNFTGGVQGFLHRWLDRENLERHNREAMDPDCWAARLGGLGFEIIHAGPIGTFAFWAEPQRRGPFGRTAVGLLSAASPLLGRLLPAGRDSYAPYRGLIARRT